MDEIATQLGMSKKTLYRFFGSKRELVRAVVAEHLEVVRGHVEEAFATPGLSMVDRLTRILRVVSRTLARIGEPFLADLARHAPEVWDEIERFRQEVVFSRLEGLITEGIREGVVRSDVNAYIVTQMLVTVARGMLVPSVLVELDVRAEEVANNLGGLLYGGILSEEGRRRVMEGERFDDEE
jgi:AcrR family transcriptional regulator